MNSTLLSKVISRMDAWQAISVIQEQYTIRFLDQAIRRFKRKYKSPWNIKKASLRVFDGVEQYPVEDDYDGIIYMEDSKEVDYSNKARFQYTTLMEFKEDPDNRNDIAEIYENGLRTLGVRYASASSIQQQISSAETLSKYSASL